MSNDLPFNLSLPGTTGLPNIIGSPDNTSVLMPEAIKLPSYQVFYDAASMNNADSSDAEEDVAE